MCSSPTPDFCKQQRVGWHRCLGFPITGEYYHSIARGELLSILVPAELGRRDGVALAGQGDWVAQDHLHLLHHVVLVVAFVPEAPGCLSVIHSVEDRRNCGNRGTFFSVWFLFVCFFGQTQPDVYGGQLRFRRDNPPWTVIRKSFLSSPAEFVTTQVY